ncbi:MAG TPA: hypothetical protein VHJ78_08915 [Actinomycetota bacterium]|nr:hypothetical protein [Actinomycetota bacterium]
MNSSRPQPPSGVAAERRVNRRFLSLFWLFAIDFAVAAFWRPALLPFLVGFPVYLLLWWVCLRRVRRGP